MNIILRCILWVIGLIYVAVAAVATTSTIAGPTTNPDGSNVPDDVEMKRFLLSIISIPVSPIIGPYFIYKVLRKGNKIMKHIREREIEKQLTEINKRMFSLPDLVWDKNCKYHVDEEATAKVCPEYTRLVEEYAKLATELNALKHKRLGLTK